MMENNISEIVSKYKRYYQQNKKKCIKKFERTYKKPKKGFKYGSGVIQGIIQWTKI